MRGRGVAFLLVVALGAACAVEETHYVGPEALNASRQPPPCSACPQATATSPTGGPPDVLCNGQKPPAAGPGCTDTWTAAIYPALINGTMKCTAAGCHIKGANQPEISNTDPALAYKQLFAFTGLGKPYINPCSPDPNQSAIACNLGVGGGAAACPPAMPQTTGGNGAQASQPDIERIKKWLACNAPL